MRNTLISTVFLFSVSVFAQSAKENELRYSNAKTLLSEKEYSLAVSALKPLLGKRDFDKAANVYYLFAVASYHTGAYEEAELMLKSLQSQYPDWPQLDEAHYLSGLLAFARGDTEPAMLAFKRVQTGRLAQESTNAKLHFLDSLTVDRLKLLVHGFPDDKELMLAYSRKLNKSFDPEDRHVLDSLVKKYRFTKKELGKGIPNRMRPKKPVYDVMVLLPLSFNAEDPFAGATLRQSQFFIDFYQGLLIGVDSLNKKGVKIQVHVYDVERDSIKLAEVLNSGKAAKMDMIIGPIITNLSLQVAAFAEEHKIVMVNPVNNHPDITGDRPYVMGTVPTQQTMANKLAAFSKGHLKTDTGLIVYYYADSTFMQLYENAMADQEIENLKSVKVFRHSASYLVDTLNTLTIDSLKHIFVPTNDQIISANLMGALDLIGHEIQVLAPSGWLNIPINDFAQYERKNINFFHPEFIDFERGVTYEFRRAYHRHYKVVPTRFAYIGYDLMVFFGSNLIKYGPDFNLKLKELGYLPGPVLEGYDFSKGSDNQYFPIIRFSRSRVVVLNRPE